VVLAQAKNLDQWWLWSFFFPLAKESFVPLALYPFVVVLEVWNLATKKKNNAIDAYTPIKGLGGGVNPSQKLWASMTLEPFCSQKKSFVGANTCPSRNCLILKIPCQKKLKSWIFWITHSLFSFSNYFLWEFLFLFFKSSFSTNNIVSIEFVKVLWMGSTHISTSS